MVIRSDLILVGEDKLDGDWNYLSGQVRYQEYTGTMVTYSVGVKNGKEFKIKVQDSISKPQVHAEGKEITIFWHIDSAVLLKT